MMNEIPMGLALLVCDTIIQDKQTNKRSLIGLFDRLYTKNLPCVHPSLSIFVSLTSGRGDYACEVICRHQETDTNALAVKGKVAFKDPMQVVDLVFNVQGVRFCNSGEYWLEFRVDNVPVMMRRIFIMQQEQTKNADNGD
ncbi:MAG: DUF6941 family protein [Lentisphaeria bacterium]